VPSQQQSPTPKNKPGNKFFVIFILAGVAVLACLWFNEKPVTRKPQPKNANSKSVVTESKTSAPVSVLVMTKSNLPPGNDTNFSVISLSKTQAVATPAVSPKTNILQSNRVFGRPAQTILEAQVALAQLGISAGSIDGVIGSQTRSALRAFQQTRQLPVTGELDAATKAKLLLTAPLYASYVVTVDDLNSIQPLGTNWWSKSQQAHLGYESLLEMISEKTCCHPNFLKRLNPQADWTNAISTTLRVLNVEKPKVMSPAAFIRIRLSEKILEAFDESTNLLAHFPCSIAKRVEKRPIGLLHVAAIAENPDYTFSPENFPESAEARAIKTKLILSPGPNNPVGTVWIGLDKPGYGIHGTPNPEAVGRTESHGCFRLANWNAEYLLRLVSVGTTVFVEP
jgi:lipoprotein-anchoring transpeptidase ErfK/SrfK